MSEDRELGYIRARIAEVARKYNVTIADAPLDAITAAMHRMGARPRSLLWPATVAKAPDITTPEGAKQARENADYYRETLKPFA